MTWLWKFARIPIGVAVIIAMEDNCLLFWRCGKHLHLILIRDPVGFETNLPLNGCDQVHSKCVSCGFGPWGWTKSFFSFSLLERFCDTKALYNEYQWTLSSCIYEKTAWHHKVPLGGTVCMRFISWLYRTQEIWAWKKKNLCAGLQIVLVRCDELCIKLNPCQPCHTWNSRKLRNCV